MDRRRRSLQLTLPPVHPLHLNSMRRELHIVNDTLQRERSYSATHKNNTAATTTTKHIGHENTIQEEEEDESGCGDSDSVFSSSWGTTSSSIVDAPSSSAATTMQRTTSVRSAPFLYHGATGLPRPLPAPTLPAVPESPPNEGKKEEISAFSVHISVYPESCDVLDTSDRITKWITLLPGESATLVGVPQCCGEGRNNSRLQEEQERPNRPPRSRRDMRLESWLDDDDGVAVSLNDFQKKKASVRWIVVRRD